MKFKKLFIAGCCLNLINAALSGAASTPVPKISASPASVNFGTVALGASSVSTAITVTNTGTSDLVVSNVTTTGTDSDEFIQNHNCGTVQPGLSCNVNVTFTPSLPYGNKAAVLAIASNASNKTVLNVNLSGKVPPPAISASPASVNLDTVALGASSAPAVVTVKNTGKSDLVVSSVTTTGTDSDEFSQTNNCGTIQPGFSCSVNVTFTPNLPYAKKTALLAIVSNDPKKSPLNVKLSGQVPPPAISATPSSLNFGKLPAGTMNSSKSVTIKNNGLSDLVIDSMNISGTNAGDFTVNGTCGTIQKGVPCIINVLFAPQVANAKRNAILDIASNDPKKPTVSLKLSGQGSVSSGSVHGTAAIGGPIQNTQVTLVDSAGTIVTGTTGTDGSFSISSTGLLPPFLLKVTPPGGPTLYSVSADASATTTINVTPLTDLIIRSWYSVQGIPIDTAFSAPATNPAPTPTAVAVISNVVQNIVQLWLNQAGVASGTNLISTQFAADHNGLDKVIDQVTVNTATGLVTITDGSTTQHSTVTYATSDGSMSVSTTTTGADGTSSSTSGTVVPVQTVQQAALDGITTTCNNFADTINTKGASLHGSDLLPYLDPTGLWDGLTQGQWAQLAAAVFAGTTVSFSGEAIKSLDIAGNVADIFFQLSQTQSGQTSTSPQELFFKKVNGTWLLSGDQRIADIEVRYDMTTSGGTGSGAGSNLEVHIDAPHGTVSGATISGGPWDATPLSPGTTDVHAGINLDSFGTNVMNPSITGVTPFTVVVTPSGGSPVSYHLNSNAVTSEPVNITNLTGSTMADAHLGSPMTVNWTLPKTFAISQVKIGTVALTGLMSSPSTFKCDNGGMTPVLSTTSTTAQVTIPATCNGEPTTQAEIYLQVYGVNGELTMAYYTYSAYGLYQ